MRYVKAYSILNNTRKKEDTIVNTVSSWTVCQIRTFQVQADLSAPYVVLLIDFQFGLSSVGGRSSDFS